MQYVISNRGVRRISQALALIGLLGAAAPGSAAPDWDMVGIKLGMTEAEARAALQAYDPKGKVFAFNATFGYSDKVNAFRTPEVLNAMEFRIQGRSNIPLRLWFSGVPGEEPRVIAIKREELNIPNAPSGEQFMKSLVGKYGQPTENDSAGTPTWQEAGKPTCIKVNYGLDYNPFASVIQTNKNDFARAVTELEQRQTGIGKGLLPADLTTCGAFFYYTGTKNNPANHFMAGMFDVGAIVAAQRARAAWVDKLTQDAIRKREGQAQAPRL